MTGPAEERVDYACKRFPRIEDAYEVLKRNFEPVTGNVVPKPSKRVSGGYIPTNAEWLAILKYAEATGWGVDYDHVRVTAEMEIELGEAQYR